MAKKDSLTLRAFNPESAFRTTQTHNHTKISKKVAFDFLCGTSQQVHQHFVEQHLIILISVAEWRGEVKSFFNLYSIRKVISKPVCVPVTLWHKDT